MVANIYWGIVFYLPGTVLNINTILVYLIITVLWDYVPLLSSSHLTDNNPEYREISLPNAQSLDANPGPCPWPLPTEGQVQGIKTSALRREDGGLCSASYGTKSLVLRDCISLL